MKICSIDGCERAVHARGYCGSHYARWWRLGAAGPATFGYPGPVARPFWERLVEKIRFAGPDECHEWTGATQNGYGELSDRPRKNPLRAHVAAWALTRGPVPDGMDVLHHCDNPTCCNPRHLFLGNDADNIRDKMLKGRAAKKLSPDQVRQIRALSEEGGLTRTEIGRRFGVSRTMVYEIATNQSWSWLA